MNSKIIKTVKKCGIPAKNIAVELTEVSSLEKVKVEDMKYLKSNGIKIYCDDFGAGYSREHVLDFPFDVIKFDGSYIRGIDKSQKKREYVEKIVNKCKLFNIKTLAENVETMEECEVVENLGIDKTQGYFYSKPLEKKDFLLKYRKFETVKGVVLPNKNSHQSIL